MKFCTYQDSTAVLVCAKFRYDQNVIILANVFQLKWNLVEISLVGWVHGAISLVNFHSIHKFFLKFYLAIAYFLANY